MSDPLLDLVGQTQPAKQGNTDPLLSLVGPQGENPSVTQSKPATISWTDVPAQAIQNLPGSTANFLGGVWQSVRHPIDTASNVFDMAAGGLHNILPNSISSAIDKIDPNPGAGQRAVNTANAVGKFYKDRYGSLDNLKNTIATDPVGTSADLSTVLSAGASLASKIPQTAKLANALQIGANYTNPANALTYSASKTAKLGEILGSNALGLTTGVGSENITNAAKAGFNGNQSFWKNMTGQVSSADILDQAKTALQNMRMDRNSEYKTGIASTAADSKTLNFTPINDSMNNVVASMKSGDHWKIGTSEVNKINEISDVVNEWKQDPSMHTAIGLDALKQRLDAIYPDSPIHNQAQRAISTVRNAVKNTIVDQSPEYASTMGAYESAINLEKEIKQALSLGDKPSADTALRKLQSLTRNNVNTNYGNRLDLAKQLEVQGGVDLLPAISGQAMNSWMPRGLAGQAEGMATIGAAALHNPMILGLLPFQSPKAVGATLYGAGKAFSGASNFTKGSGMTPDQAKMAAMLLYQSGRLPVPNQ